MSSGVRNAHLTFAANTGAGRHGWLRLTPAYSVALVREKVALLPAGSVVTDPFSGTGTTPLAAAEHGHLGQSCDVNPFLVWLGTVKTSRFDDATLAAASAAAVDGVAARLLRRSGLWEPALHRIDRWWSPGALQALRALRRAIDDVGEARVQDLHEIALCRTLIAVSNAAFDHQSMSFKLGAEVAPEHVLARFARELQALVADARTALPGSARVVLGDSRASTAQLEPCDLLLTSPPYVNRMSYIRELRPYMYWLRHLDLASDAGELDWKAIGGTWGTATSRLNRWAPGAVTPVEDQLAQVRSRIVADGGRNGPLLANYVGKYVHDMWEHFRAARDHVRPGGAVSYIVGNSTFYGHLVPVEQWYAAMLSALGFTDVTVTTIRKRNSNKRLYEFDVAARRP